MSTPALKAYAVLEKDEDTGDIIFARHAIVARKAGANEYADGDLTGVRCNRACWADEFAESGRVPASLAVKHGWWFECSGCGITINEDNLADEGLRAGGVIGCTRGPVYCSELCHDRDQQRQARLKAAQAKAIDMMKARVLRRFPDAQFIDGEFRQHAYCVEKDGVIMIRQVAVSFSFPGMKYGPAVLRFDLDDWRVKVGPAAPHFDCCNGDLEAFNAWANGTKEAA